MNDELTYVLAGITILGTLIGIVRWYKNNSIKAIKERFKDDGVHDKLGMKIKELERESKYIMERQFVIEEELNQARREIAEIRGKID